MREFIRNISAVGMFGGFVFSAFFPGVAMFAMTCGIIAFATYLN